MVDSPGVVTDTHSEPNEKRNPFRVRHVVGRLGPVVGKIVENEGIVARRYQSHGASRVQDVLQAYVAERDQSFPLILVVAETLVVPEAAEFQALYRYGEVWPLD
jgi:hypothetical protein